jgi:hypothetical protein
MPDRRRIRISRQGWAGGVVAAAALALLALPAAAAGKKSPQEWDGLVLQSGRNLDNVYVRPGVQFKAYQRVRLPPVEVSFADDWDPNHGKRGVSGRVSNEDMQNIRTGLSELFHEEFAQHLARGGYTLADTNDDDVLIVQAALTNLYITAPQTVSSSPSYTFTMDAGHVSLVMQLSDSVTQQLLARVVDTQQGQGIGRMSWTTSVSNSAEARRIIGLWADALRQALDRVNGKAP